jgi:hypothetical protein
MVSVSRVASAIVLPVSSAEPSTMAEIGSLPHYSDLAESKLLTSIRFKVEDVREDIGEDIGEDEDAESSYYRDLRRQQEERQRRITKKTEGQQGQFS